VYSTPLARGQNKTDGQLGKPCESCGNAGRNNSGSGIRRSRGRFREIRDGCSHLPEAVKRECTYVHPHFTITFAPAEPPPRRLLHGRIKLCSCLAFSHARFIDNGRCCRFFELPRERLRSRRESFTQISVSRFDLENAERLNRDPKIATFGFRIQEIRREKVDASDSRAIRAESRESASESRETQHCSGNTDTRNEERIEHRGCFGLLAAHPADIENRRSISLPRVSRWSFETSFGQDGRPATDRDACRSECESASGLDRKRAASERASERANGCASNRLRSSGERAYCNF